MSLLDDYDETNWEEYNKLGDEMEKNMNQIEKICHEFSQGKKLMLDSWNNNCGIIIASDRDKLAIGAAMYWWILAVSYLQIHMYHMRQSQGLLTYEYH
jgi:hypothetical protein